MRHRRTGRKFGRNPKHQRALLRSLASALILTERDAEDEKNAPKVKGRIVTTLPKAKEVRPLVEQCVTIARRALPHEDAASEFETTADRHTDSWRAWRGSDRWQKWSQAMAPAVAARRRVLQLLGNKEAVRVLFDEIAPRFSDREGGYTRVIRLAHPRLGDAGERAIIEFVGRNDRKRGAAPKPVFEDQPDGSSDVSPPIADTKTAKKVGKSQGEKAGEEEPTGVEAAKKKKK